MNRAIAQKRRILRPRPRCHYDVRMRSRYRINEGQYAHFVTATIVEWLPVFTTGACCEILVQSLLHCREKKGMLIHGWVILDNHFHAVLAGPELSNVVRDFKRFTARALLAQIRDERRDWLLNQLSFYSARHKSGSDHQVWQEGVHPQAIVSDEIMDQKLTYIHENPKRGLVTSPEHWRFSSAHESLVGGSPPFKCDDFR